MDNPQLFNSLYESRLSTEFRIQHVKEILYIAQLRTGLDRILSLLMTIDSSYHCWQTTQNFIELLVSHFDIVKNKLSLKSWIGLRVDGRQSKKRRDQHSYWHCISSKKRHNFLKISLDESML